MLGDIMFCLKTLNYCHQNQRFLKAQNNVEKCEKVLPDIDIVLSLAEGDSVGIPVETWWF